MKNLCSQISSAMSFWPYRYKISCNDGFQIRWWRSIIEEESAHMDGNWEVCFICMLSLFFSNDYMRGNQFRKVIHNQMCIDFLMDAHHLFWVKVQHSDGIFQVSEWGFYSPPCSIHFFWQTFVCLIVMFRNKTRAIEDINISTALVDFWVSPLTVQC